MNNLLAVLKSSTAVTPPIKQDKVPDQRGISDLLQLAGRLTPQPPANQQTPRPTETRVAPEKPQAVGAEQRGMADLLRLTAKLPQQPQADPQTPRPTEVRVVREKPQAVPASSGKQTLADLRVEQLQDLTRILGAVEPRLTPVQKGELARLRDTLPADKSSSAPVTSSNIPLALTQERLTPVQRGEREREIIASRTSGSTKSGGAPTSKPPVSLADGELLGQRQTLGVAGDFFKRLGKGFVDLVDGGAEGATDGVVDQVEDTVEAATGVRPEIDNTKLASEAGKRVGATVEDAYQIVKGQFKGVADGVINTLKKDFGVGDGWDDHLRESLSNPHTYAGYQLGVLKGVGEGIVDLAKTVGTVVQTAADLGHIPIPGAQLLPKLGDLYRDWDKTGALPDWLDQALPSEDRGRETVINAFNGVKAVGEYIVSRGKNPELIIDDIYNVIKSKWDGLKGEWEEAHKAGAKQEGEFFGKIVGRALFEVAVEFIPGKAAFSVLRAVDKVTDFANLTKKLPDGNSLHPGNLDNFGKSIDNLEAEADKLIKIKNGDDITDDQLKSLQDSYATLNNIDHNKLGSSSRAETISYNITETKHKVEEAVNTIYRLSSPEGAARRKRSRDAWNATWPARIEALKWRPGYDNDFTDPQNLMRNIPEKDNVLRLNPSEFINLDDLHRVSKDRGQEYALFEVNVNGQKRQYVFRGNEDVVKFSDEHIRFLKQHNAKLVAHTHVGNNIEDLAPSDDDIALLNEFGGGKSYIVNGSGRVAEFRADGTFTKTRQYSNAEEFNNAANMAEADTIYEYKVTDSLRYTYKTNNNGLIDTVQFLITTNNAGKRHSIQGTIGKEGVEGDVGFHLHAVALGGETNRLTVVPGNGLLNSTNYEFKTFGNWETNLLNRKKNNPNLQLEARIQVKYDESLDKGDDLFNRPTQFLASYREKNQAGEWGPWQTTTFVNEAPPKA